MATGEGGSLLKLSPSAPGFSDRSTPKPLLQTEDDPYSRSVLMDVLLDVGDQSSNNAGAILVQVTRWDDTSVQSTMWRNHLQAICASERNALHWFTKSRSRQQCEESRAKCLFPLFAVARRAGLFA